MRTNMNRIINRSLTTGLILSLISFSMWSLIFTKIFAKENQDDVLGTEFISPLADNWSPNQIMPPSTPSPIATPIIASFKPVTSPKPTPTPKPTPIPITMQQLNEWFTKYANKESVSIEELRKIADCESEYNPQAINGAYGGLFQFSKNTWITTRTKMNLNIDPDLRFNPEEAIKTAAFRLAAEGNEAWPNCHL
jgi:hypothetical protein